MATGNRSASPSKLRVSFMSDVTGIKFWRTDHGTGNHNSATTREKMRAPLIVLFLLFGDLQISYGFAHASANIRATTIRSGGVALSAKTPNGKLSDKRRKQLGIPDEDDEYDLGVALDANTDPLITKVIAGSLILVLIGLLVVGVVVPSLTDYGEGVCNPLLTQGRC